jgi:hypothetical protein
MKALVLLLLVVGLTPSCDAFSEPKPSFAYEYGVRGKGENVRVTYLTQPAGLVHETVALPWMGFAATTRPTANRVLRQEKERGTVKLSRGQVVVLDRQRLAERAGVDR